MSCLCDKHHDLPLRRRQAIFCPHCPVVNLICINFVRSHINHWFNGKDHSRYHEYTCIFFGSVTYPRIFVKLKTYPMSADFSDNCVSILHCVLVHSTSHISDRCPWFYLLKAKLYTFFCHTDKFFLLRAYLSDTEHTGGIRKISLIDGRYIYIDNISFF